MRKETDFNQPIKPPYPLSTNWSEATKAEFMALLTFKKDPEAKVKRLLFLVGALFTPVTLWGVLFGYKHAYVRLMFPKKQDPVLTPLPGIVKWAMVLGGVLIWVAILLLLALIAFIAAVLFKNSSYALWYTLAYFLVNLVISFTVMGRFTVWRYGYFNLAIERERFGTSEFADREKLQAQYNKPGFYIGGDLSYSDSGHLVTTAGTRGGKGVGLVLPNLLGKGGYKGSWVVIDPKGENAAITARYQREAGQDVIILNPWNLLSGRLGEGQRYNPLDLIIDGDPKNLTDDVAIIAEMIVPFTQKNAEDFFSNKARSLISGLILYLVIQNEEAKTLGTLWNWLRLPDPKFMSLLEKMATCTAPYNGDIVRNTAFETVAIKTSERTYTSIIGTAQQYTDFLKSPALRENIATSDIDITKLSEGKTTLYVIIPSDKLKSQYKWLRLVITTTMRAVVRNPRIGKRTTFLLDEFAALGYMSEIETALSTYAGYGVTVWPIIQSLIQLQKEYTDNWETFLGNTNVQHYFSLGDNFSADYVSHIFGTTSYLTYSKVGWFGVGRPQSTRRELLTPDEVRRGGVSNMFVVIDKANYTYFLKGDYRFMPDLAGRWDSNPYHDNDDPQAFTNAQSDKMPPPSGQDHTTWHYKENEPKTEENKQPGATLRFKGWKGTAGDSNPGSGEAPTPDAPTDVPGKPKLF